MKNLFFLAALLLASITGFSQRFENYKNPAGVAFDTVVNTASKPLVSPLMTSYYDHIAIQVTVTKISGTVAGNIILQGSLDKVNWVNIDTVAATNVATQNHFMLVEKYPWAYLRTNYTGVGTMSATYKVRALYKTKP